MATELKQEFLQRSLTAVLISAFVITLIIYSSDLITKFFIVLLSMALFFEWMKVSKASRTKKIIFLIIFIAIISLSQIFGSLFEPISLIAMLGVTTWIVVAYQMFLKAGRLSSNFTFSNFWMGLILITTFCLICFKFLNESRIFLLVIIFNIAVFDTAAYLTGKSLGKRPFLPKLSPNKTLEGLIGGFISSIIFCMCLYLLLEEVSITNALAMILSIPFALCGDYFFSFLKRKADIKDTGNVLPGHGGLLDRVDSHLAAIPMTMFLFLLLSTTGSYF